MPSPLPTPLTLKPLPMVLSVTPMYNYDSVSEESEEEDDVVVECHKK